MSVFDVAVAREIGLSSSYPCRIPFPLPFPFRLLPLPLPLPLPLGQYLPLPNPLPLPFGDPWELDPDERSPTLFATGQSLVPCHLLPQMLQPLPFPDPFGLFPFPLLFPFPFLPQ